MDEQTEDAKPAKLWLRNNLVTLGSAAVFSVYSAGYFRTREAAERFAGESVQRHAAAIAAPHDNGGTPAGQTAAQPAEKSTLPVMRLSSTAKYAADKRADQRAGDTAGNVATGAHTGVARPAVASSVDTGTRAVSTPSVAAITTTVAPTPTPAPAPVPLPATGATTRVAAPASPAPVVAPPADDSSTSAVAKRDENAPLKDGVYYGWGTSRHGDIQASVEIKSGKIVGAYISQCLTQYSCSWVSALPPEVVQRQSAEVDYVSGATQSSNAFYYAIVEALKKAK